MPCLTGVVSPQPCQVLRAQGGEDGQGYCHHSGGGGRGQARVRKVSQGTRPGFNRSKESHSRVRQGLKKKQDQRSIAGLNQMKLDLEWSRVE